MVFIFQNLCIAAAYRPVQELLQEEQKVQTSNASKAFFLLLDVLSCLSPQGEGADASPCLRPLSLDDFIQSKAKVLF